MFFVAMNHYFKTLSLYCDCQASNLFGINMQNFWGNCKTINNIQLCREN